MAILTLRVPEVNFETASRPASCRYCGASTLQRWGKVPKPVRDTTGSQTIEVSRYRCTECGQTFRHYPDGISAADQTDRLKAAAAMMWALGLPLRPVTAVLSLFGAAVCHQTVWRDAVAFAQQLGCRRRPGRVRVLGVDGTGARIGGQPSGIVVAVDMGTGKPVVMVELDEHDPEAVLDWLAPLVEQLGVEVIVTDDLNLYRPLAKTLDVDRQLCLFHVRRWVGKALRDLTEALDPQWHEILERVRVLLEELPAQGGYELCQLWEQIDEPPPGPGEKASPLYRLRNLLIRLSNSWQELLLFTRRDDVPTTNNLSEYAIGRYKLRTRTMRGVKSAQGRATIFALCHAGLLY